MIVFVNVHLRSLDGRYDWLNQHHMACSPVLQGLFHPFIFRAAKNSHRNPQGPVPTKRCQFPAPVRPAILEGAPSGQGAVGIARGMIPSGQRLHSELENHHL